VIKTYTCHNFFSHNFPLSVYIWLSSETHSLQIFTPDIY